MAHVVDGYKNQTCTSCLEEEKLLLILPTSPMLKVDESTGILSLSVALSIWRMTLGQIQKLMKKSTIGDPGM